MHLNNNFATNKVQETFLLFYVIATLPIINQFLRIHTQYTPIIFPKAFQGLNKAFDKHCQEPNKGLTFQGRPKQTFSSLRHIKAA